MALFYFIHNPEKKTAAGCPKKKKVQSDFITTYCSVDIKLQSDGQLKSNFLLFNNHIILLIKR